MEIDMSVDNAKRMETDTASGEAPNLKDRDPGHVNDVIKISFENIFAEPHPSTFSFDNVWKVSFKVFTNTRLWCYRILTLVLAVPAACLWGVLFAFLSCWAVWCGRPCLRSAQVVLSYFSSCCVTVMESFVKPWSVAIGFVFHNFKVVVRQDQDKPPTEDRTPWLCRRLLFEVMLRADKMKTNDQELVVQG